MVQQCDKGLVPIRRDGSRLAFAAPPVDSSAPDPKVLGEVAAAVGLSMDRILKARLLDNGPKWLTLLVDDVNTVLALEPDNSRLAATGQEVGVVGLYPSTSDTNSGGRHMFAGPDGAAVEVRAFVANLGISEDPVTGSLNAGIAQWLLESGDLPDGYVASQGVALGRKGRVHVTRDADGQVWVGGNCVGVINGEVTI